jgi:hypothetical protein
MTQHVGDERCGSFLEREASDLIAGLTLALFIALILLIAP